VAGLNIPEVAWHCGLPEGDVAEFYRLFTDNEKTVTLFSQGINQSSSGVDKGNAIINCHLATGRIGQPGAAPFSITGQPNAMGGREVGGLANQLAAHMDFSEVDIDRVRRFWAAPNLARQPGLKALDLFDAIADGRVKALWIMATNPVVSLPEADRVLAALRACEFVVVSDVVAGGDTLDCAHVKLPATAWGEKDGTVTNSERRISRQRAFLPRPGEARPDWWIVSEVAKRMGHGTAFDYAEPADIFREHAALSAFENAGRRDFDLSDIGHYDTLEPVQWPVSQAGGTARLFADGRFYTPSGRARMLPIAPRAPARTPDAAHPLSLNTGRIRDQWHTMTRSGKSARLLAHLSEPFIDMHPDDTLRLGLRDGQLAYLENANGVYLGRLRQSPEQRPGEVFAPIHWNGRHTGLGRIGVLTQSLADPISGQPEFKQTPVAVRPYAATWHGFVMHRQDAAGADTLRARLTELGAEPAYWCRVRGRACWGDEIAGTVGASDWHALLRHALGLEGDWVTMQDRGAGRYRGALFQAGQLQAVYFLERNAEALPPRYWLESLFDGAPLDASQRAALLLGRPSQGAPDNGRIVCACHGVGETALRQAIAAGADTVAALGLSLKAGSNCGSCIPELRKLLAAG
jgi:assimilatory nitrate reductase catalytic subunit